MADIKQNNLNVEMYNFIINRIENEVRSELDDKDSALESCLRWVFEDGVMSWMQDLIDQDVYEDDEEAVNLINNPKIQWEVVDSNIKMYYQTEWNEILSKPSGEE